MSTPDPAAAIGTALPQTTSTALLTSFTTFLTLALHSLLFHRALYPPATFLLARAYNLPVHQSRHPRVCAWVADAVAAVAEQLRRARVRRVAMSVHRAASFDVLERWVFDVARLPAFGDDVDVETGEGEGADAEVEEEGDEEDAVNWTDVNEALRGALSRIAHAAQTLPALPKGCTFTLAVELHDDAAAPIGHPQAWIPSQSDLQPPTKSHPRQGASLGGATTLPVRAVHAGPMFFECWVEQGRGADQGEEASPASKTQA